MHFNWNKKVLASSFAILSMATSLHAIPKGSCDKPADVCCENPKPGPFAFAYPMDIGLSCPRDFYIHVDGLAFQAKQDGMDYGIVNAPAGTSLTDGNVLGFSHDNNDWDYNPGMRFGAGFYLDHDAWNLDFTWTWANITNYRHEDVGAGNAIIPLWGVGSGDASASYGTQANAVWKASYNTIDFSLGKAYHVSRFVVFNPHFGARVGWIDQHFSARYANNGATNDSYHHGENDFWGIGARLGLDTDWAIGKDWSLFANLSSSIIAGKFDVTQSMTDPAATVSGTSIQVTHKSYQNTPNMEFAIGFAWSKFFDKGQCRVGLRAAYEFIEWFDQLNMRKFSSGSATFANDTVARGNFTMNGFSLRLQLDI